MAWMALGSILAIIMIVLVVGGLIAVLINAIAGVFDGEKKSPKNTNVIEYAQYKQLEDAKNAEAGNEYDFEQIDQAKAEKEQELAEKEEADIFDLEGEDENEIAEIENRLKEASENKENEEDLDIDDVLSMVDEISDAVADEQKEEVVENNESDEESELDQFNIDDYLNDQAESTEADELTEAPAEEEAVAETADQQDVQEEVVEAEELSEELLDEEILEDETDEVEEDEELIQPEDADDDSDEKLAEANQEIIALKAQLLDLNKQLEEVKSNNNSVVVIDMTEEDCVARLEVLEERLKNVKKDYKINMKEYRPLKKVMTDLEKYQTKLRRKDAVVAKKKVALYGVNNYVDIDKEKAEKLANDLELLDGLRLSVRHCEELIEANKDRFPILEHTNKILEDQIVSIEADIASTQLTLQKIREKNGNGEGSSENE